MVGHGCPAYYFLMIGGIFSMVVGESIEGLKYLTSSYVEKRRPEYINPLLGLVTHMVLE